MFPEPVVSEMLAMNPHLTREELTTGVDEEGDLDAEVEASSIELPPDEDEGESKTLPRGTRRRNLPPANVKRRSAAANYQKTSKPGKSFLVNFATKNH